LKHPILGLHHVTATVGDAQADLDFYRAALGLRLIKRTVNFDNPNIYHFYYGDERGTPGTIWTTFPYKGWGVPPGQQGQGQITLTAFSVPPGSLAFWKARFREGGFQARDSESAGRAAIFVGDPSGLAIQLVEEAGDARTPWTEDGIGNDAAIRGLHHVRMTIANPGPTLELMTKGLGFEVVDEGEGLIRLAVNGDLPGRRIELAHGTGAPRARNGIGTVHHLAMAIADGEEQARLRQELIALGYGVTEVLDRQYFQSIYFREPGGVLFEVATIQPGFTIDEGLRELGHELKLPPWEERNRATIEGRLPEVSYA
jgi:glyoxalase family protein